MKKGQTTEIITPEFLTPAFCTNLAALRKQRGLSQRAAAADLGISQALLSHYEKGTREPGIEFIRTVCRYYGVSADWLLGLSEIADRTAALESVAATLDELSARAKQALEELNR